MSTIKSSLIDDELYGLIMSDRTKRRFIADMAASRAIKDLQVPDENWLEKEWGSKHNRDIARDTISRYLSDLKEGKL